MAKLPTRLHSLDTTEPYAVEISPRLLAIADKLRREVHTTHVKGMA